MHFIEYKKLMQPHELLNTKLIRLGIKGDGGYVVPESCVVDCDYLISLGVGGDCSFDADYSHLNEKSKIVFYDGTVNSIPRTHLFRKNSFEFVKENVTEENVDRILDVGENYFLKMDIEGGEYSFLALSDPQKSLSRCKCVVAEIHWLKKRADEFKKLLEMFYSVGFRTVHLHGNVFGGTFKEDGYDVPDTIEITMVKEDMAGNEKKIEYPIKDLDFSHSFSNRDLAIRWYAE